MKKLNVAAATVAAVLLSGCYHAVIDTGRTPNNVSINRAWAHGFLWGLVPPSVTETAQKCPAGAAKVETKQSFLNLLAGRLTYGLYSPTTVSVSCAGANADASLPMVKAQEGKAAEAVTKAAEISKEKNSAVDVQF